MTQYEFVTEHATLDVDYSSADQLVLRGVITLKGKVIHTRTQEEKGSGYILDKMKQGKVKILIDTADEEA